MSRKMVIVGLLIVMSTFAILLLGCLRPVVMVRPPEPRVEVDGPPPYPEAVWRPGYWEHRGGGLGLGTRTLGKTSQALCSLGSWPLGGEKRRLGLGARILGISLKKRSSEFGVQSSETKDSELFTPNS